MAPNPTVAERTTDTLSKESVALKMSLKTEERLVTKIHNSYYDLTTFNHPGGPIAVALAFGRDGSELFESHH